MNNYGNNEESKRIDVTETQLEKVAGGNDLPSFDAQETLNRAKQELGKPYRWDSVGPEAYDCSGLVSYCLTGIHARIGTTFTFMGWQRVSDPQPGDICTSNNHCGIYAGAGQMIHAPMEGAVVCYGPVQSDMIFVRR